MSILHVLLAQLLLIRQTLAYVYIQYLYVLVWSLITPRSLMNCYILLYRTDYINISKDMTHFDLRDFHPRTCALLLLAFFYMVAQRDSRWTLLICHILILRNISNSFVLVLHYFKLFLYIFTTYMFFKISLRSKY